MVRGDDVDASSAMTESIAAGRLRTGRTLIPINAVPSSEGYIPCRVTAQNVGASTEAVTL